MRGRQPLSFEEIRQKYLRKNVLTSTGRPLHGKEIKNFLYRHARIVKELGLDMHRCNNCGMKDEWCGRPIKMELHHKNGIINDNRLINFEMLCPNCHSQTPNYKGRKSL
jgi:5-methylcytosine-specific restriction endonuclease McrA